MIVGFIYKSTFLYFLLNWIVKIKIQTKQKRK